MKLLSKVLLLGALLLALLSSLPAQQQSRAFFFAMPVASPTPPDHWPANGTAFEMPISQMPISSPTPRPIDALCPRSGTDDHNPDHRTQNAAKCDFTVKGTPIVLGFIDFNNFQRPQTKRSKAAG
jgi:hypothetical protein